MSEAGYSESSLQSERFLNGGQILTKTEALTAKQQVSTKFYFLLQCWLRSDWKFAGSKFICDRKNVGIKYLHVKTRVTLGCFSV